MIIERTLDTGRVSGGLGIMINRPSGDLGTGLGIGLGAGLGEFGMMIVISLRSYASALGMMDKEKEMLNELVGEQV